MTTDKINHEAQPKNETKTKNRFFSAHERKPLIIMAVLVAITILAAITVTIIAPIKSPKGEASDEQIQFRPPEMTVEGGEVSITYSGQTKKTTVESPLVLPEQEKLESELMRMPPAGSTEKYEESQLAVKDPDAHEKIEKATQTLSDFFQRAYLKPAYFWDDPEFKSLKEVCTPELVKEKLSTPEGLNQWSLGPEGHKDVKAVPWVSGNVSSVSFEYEPWDSNKEEDLKSIVLTFLLEADIESNKDGKTYRFTISGNASVRPTDYKLAAMDFWRTLNPVDENQQAQ